MAYPKSQSLTLPLFKIKNYISNHDILDLDICMDEILLVHVVDSMKKLSEYFDDFFFLENFEFCFEVK